MKNHDWMFLTFSCTSMNVLQMEDWVHVLRYVQILQDHSPAVVELGMLNLDMHAMSQGSRYAFRRWREAVSASKVATPVVVYLLIPILCGPSPFRDDTDERSGGCQYQWSLVGIPRQDMEYRVCFKETEGSSQCQNNRNSCSGWSNSPLWSLPFRDDTDSRGGGCTYQWRIEEQQISPSLKKSACRVCFQETEGSSQCQGSRGPTCSGWSTSPAPTDLFRDDTDGRSGGCAYQWSLECK
eukprot:Em0006g956a